MEDLIFHDKMSKLFKEDPEAFEKETKKLTEELITSASPENQLKLRLIQSKWDNMMNKGNDPHNRLVFAQSILINHLVEEFHPKMQEASQKLNSIFGKILTSKTRRKK